MPNKRKKGMRLIGTYIPAADKAEFERLAKLRGLKPAELLRELVRRENESRKASNG